jgi:hypothetical protein
MGRGLCWTSRPIRTSKFSNSKEAIGKRNRCGFFVAQIRVFIGLGRLPVECMDVRPGFSLTHQVVRGPGITGRNIGAGIECEPDEVFKIKD